MLKAPPSAVYSTTPEVAFQMEASVTVCWVKLKFWLMPRAILGGHDVFIGSQAVHVCAMADGRSVRRPKESGIMEENMTGGDGPTRGHGSGEQRATIWFCYILVKE